MSWPGIDEWIGGPYEQELMPMSWESLRATAEAGWEIGPHTVSHPHLTTRDDAELREELVQSREKCRAFGTLGAIRLAAHRDLP